MRSVRDIFRSYAEFDAEGRHVNGSDKQSNHNYGDAYESIISSMYPTCVRCGRKPSPFENPCLYCNNGEPRCCVSTVMEVGVADGSSLLAWREVFPNALIVGMDIHHSDKAHGERIEFHIGDQRSQRDCENAVAGRQFDLIVEDATHKLPDTLCTLLYLWPYVKPGGLYVIEEFDNIGALRTNIHHLFHPKVDIIDTQGPFGGIEPLVVLRKK